MALFLIVGLQSSAALVDAAVSAKVPQQEAYKIEPGKWAIDVNVTTAKAASDMLGLTDSVNHLTLPIRAYFGRAQPELWEWLAAKIAGAAVSKSNG